jgi:WhiB family redox-sensing transcriptional regulator
VDAHGIDTSEGLPDAWAWRQRAACRNADLQTFFGPEHERPRDRALRERRARAICAG